LPWSLIFAVALGLLVGFVLGFLHVERDG